MTDFYSYTKKRNELNRPTNLTDTKVIMKIGCIPDPDADEDLPHTEHVVKNPNRANLNNFPLLSEGIVNTERVSTLNKSLFHYEGGWPKDVDITDKNEMKKTIKKKLEKTIDNIDKFAPATKKMCEVVESIIYKNNQIDMFEEYFEGEEVNCAMDKVKVKTLKLFKNCSEDPKRTVTNISWHPDGSHRLAASYSVLRFQQLAQNSSNESYIWDVNNPNSPLETLKPPSAVVKLAYNHKNTDQLAFGCYNGVVGVWDLRVNRKTPSILSEIETSHYEPVVDLFWLSSKGGNEFVSCSTDGRVIWWDYRNISQPTDVLVISESQSIPGNNSKVVGATSLEYVADYGPKYLVGTETGAIMLATKKPKKNVEINFNNSYGLESVGRHMGPVTRIQRNPFNPRFFMSVGDWSVNIWEDDLKTPIMSTSYHSNYLSDGCWSPTRPGVFFVTRKDGWLDIWDYYYKQNEKALSHKVSNSGLSCLKINNVTGMSQIGSVHPDIGKFCAVGDTEETITLLKLCKSLYKPQTEEKTVTYEMFDRERVREDMLKKQKLEIEARKNLMQKEKERKEKAKDQGESVEAKRMNAIREIENDFNSKILSAKNEMRKLFKISGEDEKENKDEHQKEKLELSADKSATKEVNLKEDEADGKEEDVLNGKTPNKKQKDEEGFESNAKNKTDHKEN